MTQTDRRTICLLCNGRCDPDKWTCRRCHARMLAGAVHELIDRALEDYAHSRSD